MGGNGPAGVLRNDCATCDCELSIEFPYDCGYMVLDSMFCMMVSDFEIIDVATPYVNLFGNTPHVHGLNHVEHVT